MIFSSPYPSVPLPDEPVHVTVLNALKQHSDQDKGHVAMITAHDQSERITSLFLLETSHKVASFLAQRGFVHSTAAAVLPNSWHYAAFFCGVGLQGGAVSGASALFTDYELERQFVDSQSTVVFTNVDSLSRVQKALNKCLLVKTVIVIGGRGLRAPYYSWDDVEATPIDHNRKQVPVSMDDMVVLPYSSGTTGSPKGVVLTHRNFAAMMALYRSHSSQRITPPIDPNWCWKNEVGIMMLPFYHIYGFGVLVSSLIHGSSSIVMAHFDPVVYLTAIQKYKVRQLTLVPPILVFLAKHPICDKFDLSSVKAILSGAAPAGRDICEELMRRLPNVKFITQGYGMTELSMACHFPDLTLPIKYGSAGRLCSNLEMKIVDVSSGKSLNVGERGEICIRGPTVMKGYLNRPEATAETIKADGWLHTGDIGYVDSDGDLFIVDRLKELIKVKGLQVPPAELEDLLLSHPGISDAAVIGIPDKKVGELVKAFVVRAANSQLTEKDVAEFVADKVSSYKRLTGGVEFIKEVPKSAAGKILRRQLRDMQNKAKL